jgi:hypothetical protein
VVFGWSMGFLDFGWEGLGRWQHEQCKVKNKIPSLSSRSFTQKGMETLRLGDLIRGRLFCGEELVGLEVKSE